MGKALFRRGNGAMGKHIVRGKKGKPFLEADRKRCQGPALVKKGLSLKRGREGRDKRGLEQGGTRTVQKKGKAFGQKRRNWGREGKGTKEQGSVKRRAARSVTL